MSRIAVTGNPLGTGTFTIASPNSNSDFTLTLPSASGTLATAETAGFESGTKMLFQQTAAPTGWTKDTTHNNKALRVVSGTASTGGSVAFTTAFASQAVAGTVGNTTLTTTQMPSHSHVSYNQLIYTLSGPEININTSDVNFQYGKSGNTSSTGGGSSHNHTFTGTAIDMAVQYVDVIIATKD